MVRTFNFQKWLMQWLRRGSYRVPTVYSMVKTNARIERGQYRCQGCKSIFTTKEIQIDHIHPVIDPKSGFTTWDDYIARLFCGPGGLQVLCKPCHQIKTKKENKKRRKA